jgi:hypothetical protein
MWQTNDSFKNEVFPLDYRQVIRIVISTSSERTHWLFRTKYRFCSNTRCAFIFILCFGLSWGHQQAYQYRNLIKEDMFVFGATAPSGPGPPHSRGFYFTHNDAPQSVGLLWTSDQLVAETSTWQHTTLTTDKYPLSGGIRTHNLSRRAALNRADTGIGEGRYNIMN